MDGDILPILQDWGTRDLKSRTVETLLRDAADEIVLLRTTIDESTAALSSNVTALVKQIEENKRLRALIKEWDDAGIAVLEDERLTSFKKFRESCEALREEARRG